jgi:hypothetical protein
LVPWARRGIILLMSGSARRQMLRLIAGVALLACHCRYFHDAEAVAIARDILEDADDASARSKGVGLSAEEFAETRQDREKRAAAVLRALQAQRFPPTGAIPPTLYPQMIRRSFLGPVPSQVPPETQTLDIAHQPPLDANEVQATVDVARSMILSCFEPTNRQLPLGCLGTCNYTSQSASSATCDTPAFLRSSSQVRRRV